MPFQGTSDFETFIYYESVKAFCGLYLMKSCDFSILAFDILSGDFHNGFRFPFQVAFFHSMIPASVKNLCAWIFSLLEPCLTILAAKHAVALRNTM